MAGGGKTLAGLAAATVAGSFIVAVAVLAGQHDDAGALGKLVYIHDGDLWSRALPDGKPRQLTQDGDDAMPRWSPSG